MKRKLLVILSSVLLIAGVACQSPVKTPEPYNQCNILILTGFATARCCIKLCQDKRYPEAAFKRCAAPIVEDNYCTFDESTIIFYSLHSCRCN